jgi:hypothetical protein
VVGPYGGEQTRDPGTNTYSPIPRAEVDAYIHAIRTEHYEWVVPAFEARLKPDPDAVNPLVSMLESMQNRFGGDADGDGAFKGQGAALGRINDIRTDMGFWHGTLQVNFIDNFLTPLETVAANQAPVMAATRAVLMHNKVLYIQYRQDVLNLLESACQAVKATDAKSPGTHMWGTLVGISIGTLLTLAVPVIAAAGAALIVTSTLLQGVTQPPPPEMNLGAPTTLEVAANIVTALQKIDADTAAEDVKVQKAFQDLRGTVSAWRATRDAKGSGPLSVARPAISGPAAAASVENGALLPLYPQFRGQ